MVRVEHVMKGYRADHLSSIETLVFMALRERTHAVFCRRLAEQIEDPTLRAMIEAIANDEERHQEYFSNLVAACLRIEPDQTVAAVADRSAELRVVGADIDAYQDKVANMAKTGIFDENMLRECVSDAITAWDLAAHPEMSAFVVR
jgi:acyl-[acyl-carrier-protein] desaturase